MSGYVRESAGQQFGGARRWVQKGIAAVAFAVSVYGLWWWTTTYQQLVSVIVAAHDLPAHTVLSNADLTTRLVPVGSTDPHTAQDLGELVGKLLIAPIFAGETIRGERLSEADGIQRSSMGIAVIARPGERLVGIQTDLAALAGGGVALGEAVDIYVVPSGGAGVALVAAGVRIAEIRTQTGQSFQPGSQIVGNALSLVLRGTESQVRALLEASTRGRLVVVRLPAGERQ